MDEFEAHAGATGRSIKADFGDSAERWSTPAALAPVLSAAMVEGVMAGLVPAIQVFVEPT